MPGEGPTPGPSEGAQILSGMVQEDGGRSNMSAEDQHALDDLLVEDAQKEAEARGELLEPTEVEPADVRNSMVEHSGTWQSNEQQQ